MTIPTANIATKIQFRLTTMFALTAAIAVSCVPLAYGGTPMILVSVYLLSLFLSLFFRRVQVVCGLLFFGVVAAIFWPEVGSAREAARRNQCIGNLRFIAVAIANYESTNGHYPPAYLSDEDGVPMHSWRVLILPYLGHEAKSLYDRYDFAEPWNGPNNSKLAAEIPRVYQCPSDALAPGDVTTSYLAVVGNGTMWPHARSRKLDEVTDGVASTILLVESCEERVPWMKPRDISFGRAMLAMKGGQPKTPSSHHHDGSTANMVFVDARYSAISRSIDRLQLRAMLTLDGGENVKGFD